MFAHAQGRIHDRSRTSKEKRVMALNLMIAAIIFWHTLYMDKAVNHLQRSGQNPDPRLLPFTSPLGWEHISLTGDYDWHSGARDRTLARPLNLKPGRQWTE